MSTQNSKCEAIYLKRALSSIVEIDARNWLDSVFDTLSISAKVTEWEYNRQEDRVEYKSTSLIFGEDGNLYPVNVIGIVDVDIGVIHSMIQNDDTEKIIWYASPEANHVFGITEPLLDRTTGISAKPYKNLVGKEGKEF